jgi:putative peptidoglycan lipid II flippase
LTASAGISGWIEFALLRRSLGKKIGSDPVGVWYLARLWIAAIAASGVAWAIKLQLTPALHPIEVAAAVLAPYGVLYLLLAGGGNIRRRLHGLPRR